MNYLKKKGGYTKNYRTGVRLCQCGHLYDVEAANTRDESGKLYIRAKCRPTMRKTTPFYALFVVVENQKPVGGNCFCAAGASQSCVLISALLLTLTEITSQACTSVRCAWSRLSVGGNASLAKGLDFGKASIEGYFPYTGPKPDLCSLLKDFDAIGSKPAIIDHLNKVSQKQILQAKFNSSFTRLNSKLLLVTLEKYATASLELYPPSLAKILLGDYGRPNSLAIQWGCEQRK